MLLLPDISSYFNFKGAWEYAKTPKLSEMNYLTALLTPENFENLTVSQMRDEGEDVPSMGKISSEAANAEATESEAVSAASTEAAMVSTEKQE